ncbi:MAG: sigma 54-interacting transcriptional regulator [Candidatus Schekmanbacteria bacterium]|nr:sigma 54-interacting transcriptional regulator [Candidatus Schekmanbacteria bacterium]
MRIVFAAEAAELTQFAAILEDRMGSALARVTSLAELHEALIEPCDAVILTRKVGGKDLLTFLSAYRDRFPGRTVLLGTSQDFARPGIPEKVARLDRTLPAVELAARCAAMIGKESRNVRPELVARLRNRAAAAPRELAEAVPAGASNVLEQAYGRALALARSPLALLLCGPFGVGKRVLAAAVHRGSKRPGALVELDLTEPSDVDAAAAVAGASSEAFAGSLVVSWTGTIGAAAQRGLIEASRAGTRVILCWHRPESSPPVRTELVFLRPDLELAAASTLVWVPPLSTRGEDLDVAIEREIRRAESAMELAPESFGLTADATRALHRHSWPGNEAELAALIEVAAHVARFRNSTVIDLEDLPRLSVVMEIPAPEARGAGQDALAENLSAAPAGGEPAIDSAGAPSLLSPVPVLEATTESRPAPAVEGSEPGAAREEARAAGLFETEAFRDKFEHWKTP